MSGRVRGRLVVATAPGATIDRGAMDALGTTPGVQLLLPADLGMNTPLTLPPPFEEVPVFPEVARYAGEPLAILVGRDWIVLDQLVTRMTEFQPSIAGPAEESEAARDATKTQPEASVRSDQVAEAEARRDALAAPGAPGAITTGPSPPHGFGPAGEPVAAAIARDRVVPADDTSPDGDEAGEAERPTGADAPAERAADVADTADVSASTGVDGAGDAGTEGTLFQIVEGTYRTRLQLHMADEPLSATAHVTSKGVTVDCPTQWPAKVRAAVATALGVSIRSVTIQPRALSGSRDAAIWMSAYLAVAAALAARATDAEITVAFPADQRHLTGGRIPATITWVSHLDPDGMLLENTVSATFDVGAYPTLLDEAQRRSRLAAESLYNVRHLTYEARFLRSPAVPMGVFEGLASAPIAFAREVHYNRLAELAQEDPIIWRLRHVRRDWPILGDLLDGLAEESDFHRRYSSHELIRKRRLQLPRNSKALRGIGCAMAEQVSGMTGDREGGSITIRLEQGGTAFLHCSLPTPTPRLALAWRHLVAQELGLAVEDVAIDTSYQTEHHDSGPRLFSRGVSVVPRTIQSICQAIQRQRFREPLPIQIRRSIRTSRSARTPAHALRSAGATAVEVVLLPGSMEIEVKSVTMAVYAGRVLDRGMAEAELRRGIYQALTWSLHEAVTDPTALPPSLRNATGPRHYSTAFRGRPPKIRIKIGSAVKRDGPTGIGELPFSTVPAALTSALSQASGLYLDSIPTRPADLLRMLRED